MAASLGDLITSTEASAMDNQTLALARLKNQVQAEIINAIGLGVKQFTMRVQKQFTVQFETIVEGEGYVVVVTPGPSADAFDSAHVSWT